MADFTYTQGRLSDAALADLAPDFESLEPSEYADGSYRLRRFSRLTFDRPSRTVELRPNTEFVQGDDLNRFQGNVARRYDDVLESTWKSAGFAEMCATFADAADLPAHVDLEVHQMRVRSTAPDDVVEAAPEGVHQDGFDRISMFTIAREHTVGPELRVHEGREEAPIVDEVPQAGEYTILNDRELWHSAGQVVSDAPGAEGHWDLFVLCAHR